MRKSNLLNKVLISHDTGWYNVGQPGGGDFSSYTEIFTHLIPALENTGFTKEEIDRILIENPKEAYTIRIRRL